MILLLIGLLELSILFFGVSGLANGVARPRGTGAMLASLLVIGFAGFGDFLAQFT